MTNGVDGVSEVAAVSPVSEPPRGLPDDLLRELGRLLIAAGNLEGVMYDIARALGVLKPSRLSAKQAAKQAAAAVREDPPPWSRVDAETVAAWTTRAQDLLERRNMFVHATNALRVDGEGQWQPAHISLRDNAEVSLTVARVGALVRDMRTHRNEGHDLHHELLLQVRPGVYFDVLGEPGAPTIVVQYAEGGWPERPTPEELDAWYRSLSTTTPPAWGAWASAKAQP